MTANASSATRNAVGNSLTNLAIGPEEWLDRGDVVGSRVVELARVARAPVDPGPRAIAPVAPFDAAVCGPAWRAFPLVALPVVARARPEAPRGVRDVDRVPDADVPCTDGADDPEVSPPDPVEGDVDPRRGGETGDPTVGVWTGGIEGVLTDGIVMLGVVIFGVVTGPVVTEGTVTDGTLTDGIETVGTETVGIDTVGIETVGDRHCRQPGRRSAAHSGRRRRSRRDEQCAGHGEHGQPSRTHQPTRRLPPHDL